MSLASLKGPGRKDWQFVRGDSFLRTLTVKQGGNPFDFTGWEVEAFVIESFPFSPTDDSIETFAAAIVSPATDGKFTIQLTATQTLDLPAKAGWHVKVKLTADTENNTHTLLEGELTDCDG